MGGGTFDKAAYSSYSASTRGKKTEEIYTSRSMDSSLDPNGVAIRESRDSEDNPKSSPIIVALDVTGSMGILARVIATEGLGTLFEGIFDRQPVTDPHVMFMAIGDANYDDAPLQVSQFEADNRIVDQLTKIWIESGGGGNNFESYNLAWYFAAFHTEHDSIIKRGKRGYLFTVGDEEAPQELTRDQISKVMGGVINTQDISNETILRIAQQKYDVFHVVIKEGHHAQRYPDRVMKSWTELLGQRVIPLADHTLLAETIVSAIEVAEGRDAADSASKWGDSKGSIVHSAVKSLPSSKRI